MLRVCVRACVRASERASVRGRANRRLRPRRRPARKAKVSIFRTARTRHNFLIPHKLTCSTIKAAKRHPQAKSTANSMESVAGGSQATANVTSQSLEQTVCGVSPFSCFFFVGGFFFVSVKNGSLILDTHLAFIGTSFTTNVIYSHLQCVPGQKRTNRKKRNTAGLWVQNVARQHKAANMAPSLRRLIL